MKKTLFGCIFLLIVSASLSAEGFTLYMGKINRTNYLGASIGGDVGDFIQLQVDVMKYLKDDPGLVSDDPKMSRGDFLGVSANFALKLPLHLIPHLDRFDYIQPYLLVGRGFASENMQTAYNAAPNLIDGKTGLLSKIRSYRSFGYGILVMISSSFGLKVDYRSIQLEEHTGLGLPGRKFDRLSFGICFGTYKTPIKRIKK